MNKKEYEILTNGNASIEETSKDDLRAFYITLLAEILEKHRKDMQSRQTK